MPVDVRTILKFCGDDVSTSVRKRGLVAWLHFLLVGIEIPYFITGDNISSI